MQNPSSNFYKQDFILSRIIGWIKSHYQILKILILGSWALESENLIILYIKVHLIKSWYVQLCMIHISRKTQGVRKIIALVNITSFPNNLSQSNHFLQWLCKVVSEEDTMITGTTKKLKLTMHAFTINLGIYHFALNGLKWSKTLSLFDAVPF